jgi:hypothetical protein
VHGLEWRKRDGAPKGVVGDEQCFGYGEYKGLGMVLLVLMLNDEIPSKNSTRINLNSV